MRYASVRNMDISNGEQIGVSLFVQGCNAKCEGCFNPETWDFDGGKEWSSDVREKFINLINREYIKRVSFLGGEPLAYQNVEEVLSLIKEIKNKFPNKKIWLYTGFTWNQIFHTVTTDDLNPERDRYINARKETASLCDVVVDGRYVNSLRDITLPFCGSSNQRLIDVRKTLEQNEIVLYNV